VIERKYAGAKPKTVLPAGTIDTQLHVYEPGFPARPGGPALPDGLPGVADYERVMTWLGIDRYIITQGNAHQKDNSNLIAALKRAGDAARGVAVIDGDTSDQELEMMSQAGVVGARIMDLPGGAVGLEALERVEERAYRAGWMMAVQFNGSGIAQHFDQLARIRTNWVFDHHGKFFQGAQPDGPEIDLTKRLIDQGNCWFKFAGCYESSQVGGPEFSDIAANAREIASYAPERIIWGTNFPHNGATSTETYPDDAVLLDTSMGWFSDDQSRKLALVDNPEKLFGF